MAIGYLGLHSGREAPCGESSADEVGRKGGGGSTDNWASMETIRDKKKMNGGSHTTMPVDIACASVQRPSRSIELRRAQRTIQSTARDALVVVSSRIGVIASRKWPCVCVSTVVIPPTWHSWPTEMKARISRTTEKNNSARVRRMIRLSNRPHPKTDIDMIHGRRNAEEAAAPNNAGRLHVRRHKASLCVGALDLD